MNVLASSVEVLEQEVTALKLAAENRAKTGLVEDYFTVNEEEILFEGGVTYDLAEPFCIQGPGVIDFSLAASFASAEEVNRVSLMIGGSIVAQAEI